MKKAIIAVLAIIVVAGVVIFMNMGNIAKTLVERVATNTLQTPVTVGSLDISIAEQRVQLDGLVIKNPEGFPSADMMKVASIVIAAEDLTGETLIFREVAVNGMEVFYDLTPQGNNLSTVKKNIKASDSNESADSPAAERKVAIRALNIAGARITPNVSGIEGKSFSKTVDLPEINMTNIGTEKKPAEADAAISAVLRKIIDASTRAIAKDELKNTVGDAIGGEIGEKTKGLMDSILP